MSLTRRARACAALLVCLASLAAAPVSGAPDPAPEQRSSAAERALAAFRSRDYASARTAFDEAVPAASPEDVATLRFNAAVCAYQLADYADAERRFMLLAEQPALAPLALLHAGLSALGRGDPARARALLEQAPPGDAESKELRAELRRALDSSDRERERKAFEANVQRGLAAFKAGRWRDTEQALAVALEHRSAADDKELASVHYLLSNAALERGDTAAARRHAEQSLAHDRSDGVLEVQLGDVARAERDFERAEQSYRRALELGLDARDGAAVKSKLEALYPLPRAGAFAWAVSGGGYDSNAAQSGLAEAIAATETSARAASAFTTLAASAGYVFRLGPRIALAPYYAFDWLLLFAPAVRELSLQAHAAGLRLHWAPRPELDVRFTGATTLTLTGFEQSQAFSFETLLGGEIALSHGAHATSLARLDVRGLYGLSGYDYLTGTRIDLALGERLRWARADALLSAGFRFNEVGVDEVPLRQELLAGCGPICNGLVYRVPFGYRGPWADVRLGYQLTAALRVEGNFRVEYRRYTDQSFITLSGDGPPIVLNPKTREDVRLRPGARVELELDDARRWQLAADYLVWLSTSNVAYDAGDPQHALDYDDRNFAQQVLELSLAAQF